MSRRSNKRAKAKREMRRGAFDNLRGSRDHLTRPGSQNPHKQGPTGKRQAQRAGNPRY